MSNDGRTHGKREEIKEMSNAIHKQTKGTAYNAKTRQKVQYPYMTDDGDIRYVPADNKFMQAAEQVARQQSLDKAVPTGSVVVKNGRILGRGANGSTYHDTHECERVKRGIPTGQGYELCEGCHPKNHSEPTAIHDALTRHTVAELQGAELYLWGHWWCCEWCWQAMLEAGIRVVYLLDGSEILFNKTHPDNILS